MTREINVMPLGALKANPLNPKKHDNALIDKSLTAFGYIDPIVIDGRTGFMISGHGRDETLRQMQEQGKEPPAGIVIEDGEWMVPVITGWSSKDDTEAHAALVALNRTTEQGGWDRENLLTILQELQASDDLALVGFVDTDIAMLERALEAEGAFTVDLHDAIDEFIDNTGVDLDGRTVHYSTVLHVYFQTETARQEFFDAIGYVNEGKKQASIRYPKSFVRETAEQWTG